MAAWPNDYYEKVVKDVEKYNGIRKIVKTNFIERWATKYSAPEHLHPNPEDEFSIESIGPNMEIVSNYVQEVKFLQSHPPMDIYEDPLIVQKMEPDGYMLLNGHHRWFAALRMNAKKVHIRIVNMINENDVHRMTSDTENTKLVTFDFDEVLIAPDDNNQAPLVFSFFKEKYNERLRIGAPEVIKAFQSKGYDVCVYTAGYFDEEDFKNFFSMYKIEVKIIVNGLNEKRGNAAGKADNLKELLKNKYKQIVHVDNETIYDVDHVTHNYEMYELNPELTWADGITDKLSNL